MRVMIGLLALAPCSALLVVPSSMPPRASPPSVPTKMRTVSPCMASSLIENVAPLLALPMIFIGAQTLAEMGSDKIAPGVDLEPKTAEELEKNPPKPLTSFLPDWMPFGGGGNDESAGQDAVMKETGNDFYARREDQPLKLFPLDDKN